MRVVTVEVRCDTPDCEVTESIRGDDVGGCKAELRHRGWKLGRKGDDRCPRHYYRLEPKGGAHRGERRWLS